MPSYNKEEDEESGPENEEIVRQVFKDEAGNPICFFIHESVKESWIRGNLTADIEKFGGIVQPNDKEVDTVIIDESSIKGPKTLLQLSYDVDLYDRSRRRTWVEPKSFVQRCILEGMVRHSLPVKKAMGGSLRRHKEYTPKDDEHLARYIALRIPDKEAGGRRGEGLYQELEALGCSSARFSWAKRHTGQSWRNRYNKNTQWFDPIIDYYVKLEKPTAKQLYARDRRMSQRKSKQIYQDDVSVEEEEYEEYGQHPSPPPAKRRRPNEAPRHGILRSPKGKERASESPHETDDELPKQSSLFSEPESVEAHPSAKQRAPPITYAKRKRQIPPASPPPFPTQPQTSQATLIASSPQIRRSGPILIERTSHFSHQQFEQRTPTFTPEPPLIFENEVRDGLSPVPQIFSANEFNILSDRFLPAPTPFILTESTTTGVRNAFTAASRQRRQVAIKKVQPVVPVATPYEPPYRNTRSRAQSVEPSVGPFGTKSRVKGKEELVEGSPVLAPLEELEEDEIPVEEIPSVSGPIGETLDEELDVEHFLVNNVSGQSHATEDSTQDSQEAPLQVASPLTKAVDESMDSDDVQTHQMLRQPPPKSISQRPTSIFDADPETMLRRFQATLPGPSTARSSRRSSVRPMAFTQLRNEASRRPRHSAPGPRRRSFEAPPSQPRTPVNVQFQASRDSSVLSEEMFPVAGTKASAVKKRIEAEEKRTPYRPPTGTRAAVRR
ncbi:hypothetical protein D9615_004132 [Tricholomella constricta]|uniref:TERF2-interacting telomeric protein 1 Myb domain-containing protein n=1 Tax=Tricholomella constricta TaxID=117010 RepID=A0A8H5HCP7_9AGAR|nr:hypothetical protein D9615_004132 [Tricholomella constricta]